jgi:hypothetical protein
MVLGWLLCEMLETYTLGSSRRRYCGEVATDNSGRSVAMPSDGTRVLYVGAAEVPKGSYFFSAVGTLG